VSVARKLESLAALVGGTIEGDGSLDITGVCALEDAVAGQLTFYGNQRYKQALAQTKASAVLVSDDVPRREDLAFVRVKQPHLAFARIAAVFHPPHHPDAGISTGAHVHPGSHVDPTATVMAGAVVSRGALVGPRAVLYPGVYLGDHAAVGEGSVLHANAVVEDGCTVGARCILHAGCVVGSDGFGFAFDAETPAHVKIPQVGVVRVEDDVEIGANSTVDRATTGATVIGRGTKIDNLVQVGHNVTIGPLCIICGQAGISGSTSVGTGVVLAGQAGVVGHIHLGDMAKIGAQAGVMNDVPPGETVVGAPAVPRGDFLRQTAVIGRLPELVKELRDLRKRVEQLEGKGGKR